MTKDLTVLFVEEDETTRNTVEEFLKLFFKKIYVVDDYKKAQRYYNKYKIDILITEIDIQGQDCFKLVNNLRETDINLPVIILSNSSDKDYLFKSIKFDIDAYILKPLKIEDFCEAIEKINYKHQIDNKVIQINENFSWCTKSTYLHWNDTPVNLTRNEQTLIELLIKSPSWYVSFEQIYNAIFIDSSYDKKRVQNIVYRLNKKLNYQLLYSQYGDGYYLNINSFPE